MNERVSYLIRRLLLIVPTFIGITLCSFLLCQTVPGGPVEQAMIRMRGQGAQGESTAQGGISPAQREALVRHFGFDKPLWKQYTDWLFKNKLGLAATSYHYNNKSVWELISDRFGVSLTFGITSFFLTYLICIPLGIAKALRDGTAFDLISSIVVFVGYAIPTFAFGMILKMLFSGTSDNFWDWFPIGGFRSDGFDKMSFWQQVADQAHHMFLPVLCYVIGNFAFLTLIVKNSLLEQIGQDYVRTVVAKGGNMKRAIWRHALRNALIPLATGIGGVLTIMFAGAVIIEQVFNIPGMGKLSLEAAVGRDYMVFMGLLSITSLLGLLGRVLSDFCYMLVDPRISFGKE